ncbi:hypothetical protein HAT2_00309 [Candidatus Similichlamydia laticola]|uniref:Uncharacterized protein n=1 Tax=Candidatus Similichlamydia laticola TaxID=2170265 RepID=A0A369KII8_9BACT|nr:hypothetical protein HAT2_00309 [Candidatus Similichlamydia laticola]
MQSLVLQHFPLSSSFESQGQQLDLSLEKKEKEQQRFLHPQQKNKKIGLKMRTNRAIFTKLSIEILLRAFQTGSCLSLTMYL